MTGKVLASVKMLQQECMHLNLNMLQFFYKSNCCWEMLVKMPSANQEIQLRKLRVKWKIISLREPTTK